MGEGGAEVMDARLLSADPEQLRRYIDQRLIAASRAQPEIMYIIVRDEAIKQPTSQHVVSRRDKRRARKRRASNV